MTDAFNIAFRIPNLLRRLSAEGAFSQAFVPILAEFKNQQGESAMKGLINATSTVMFWTLMVLSVIGILGASSLVLVVATGLQGATKTFDAAVFMTQVMLPYIVLISLTSLASCILNTWKQFSLPAFAPVLLNVSFIASSLWLAPHLKTPIYALAFAVILGGIAQLLIQFPALKRIDMLPRLSIHVWKALSHPGVKRTLFKMAPAILAVSVAQISLIINTNIASRLSAGSVSWLSYADRLMEFPTALLGVALGTILLPSLSKAHANLAHEEYSKLLDWGLRLTFLLAMPSAVTLLVFAKPLTATLYGYGRFNAQDIAMTSSALTAYGVGLVGLILIKILAPGFYAKQDIKTPVKIALVVLVFTQLSNLLFVRWFAHAGLALSIGVAASINAMLLYRGLRKRNMYQPSAGWFSFILKMSVASALLAGILYWSAHHFDWILLGVTPLLRIGLMLGSLLTAAMVYFAALWLFGLRFSQFHLRDS